MRIEFNYTAHPISEETIHRLRIVPTNLCTSEILVLLVDFKADHHAILNELGDTFPHTIILQPVKQATIDAAIGPAENQSSELS